ncbi:unnamed protein product [Aphanomyces euteiches]
MEKNPPTPEAGYFTIKCVEDAVAFMALDDVPARASLYGKVLWTEQRKEDMAVVFLAPLDDCSDIGDLLSVTQDATQEIKTKNMKFLLCSSDYGAQDAAQQFSVGRLVHYHTFWTSPKLVSVLLKTFFGLRKRNLNDFARKFRNS